MAYEYARGFVAINRIAIGAFARELPARLRPMAHHFLLEGLLRANWEDGNNPNGRDFLNLQRGQFPMGLTEMAQTLGTSFQALRTLLGHLQDHHVIEQKSTSRGRVITICNFDTYCPPDSQINKLLTSYQQATNNSEQEQQEQQVQHPFPPTTLPKPRQRKSTAKTAQDPEPSEDAQRAAQRWFDLRPFDEKHRPTYCRVFDDMHLLDRVEWNSNIGIHAIVEHALTVWQPAHIQSPSKLRMQSKAYPEKKTWEVIRDQILHPMVASIPGRETVAQRLARRRREREAQGQPGGSGTD